MCLEDELRLIFIFCNIKIVTLVPSIEMWLYELGFIFKPTASCGRILVQNTNKNYKNVANGL